MQVSLDFFTPVTKTQPETTKPSESSRPQVAEIQLSYKTNVNPADRAKITCSNDSYDILLEKWDKDSLEFVEEFKILILNRQNRVLGIVPISKGGVAGTVADPKLIFAAALKANGSSIILAHNHPSGNLKPSEADIRLTKKLVEAGKFLELPVLDHIILTPFHSYYSFADEGIL